MKAPLSVLVLGLAAFSLHAQPTVGHPDFDPFANATGSGGSTYTVGANLAGQTNAQGLPWFAAGSGSGQPVVSSGTLTYPGLLPNSGNSITYGASAGTSARLDLGTTAAKSVISGSNALTLYYSMLFKVIALDGLSSTPAVVAGFNNSTGTQTEQPSIIGARLYTRLSGLGYNLGINKADGTATDIAWETSTYAVGTTYFVVAAYTFSGTPSAANDSVSLWVNLANNTFGAASAPVADLTTAAGSNIGSTSSSDVISSFLLRQASTLEPGTMIVDELSIGLAWADVTPGATMVSPFSITAEYADNTGTNFVITWQSVSNATYHLVGTNNLATTAPLAQWPTVAGPITATSTSTSVTNSITMPSEFFSVISP